MKKTGRFLKNIFLIKYYNITFQSGMFNNASFIAIKKTDLRGIEYDLLNPTFVMEKLTELED